MAAADQVLPCPACPPQVIADPELSKRMTMRNNARALTRHLQVNVKDDLFNTKGLASAK
jgi:hypothetical protein